MISSMGDNTHKYPDHFLFFLIAGISLSTAGSAMSLISISTLLFKIDVSGTYSSLLQIAALFGIVATGFFGGSLIGKMTSKMIGWLMPVLSASVLLNLLFLEITLYQGLAAIFILSCLYGIEHPNNIRILNQLVVKEKKASVFSFYQTISQAVTMFSPLIASFIIAKVGIKFCIAVDIATCLMSALIWISFPIKERMNKDRSQSVCAWEGYRLLVNNPHIRNLNISRIINNISFITFSVGLPIFIANLVKGDAVYFAALQGYTTSATAIAFVIAGCFGTVLLKKYPGNIGVLTTLASTLGFFAVVFEYFASTSQMIIFAAIMLGVGQFCFRISGITLGQSVTPPEHLGQVIIAGDTIVRLSSFLFALFVPDLIYLSYKTSFLQIIAVASLTLYAPFLLRNVARAYREKLDALV